MSGAEQRSIPRLAAKDLAREDLARELCGAKSQSVAGREWLDLRGLTMYAAVSERTIREWLHRSLNPLPAVRVGTKILIRRSTFDAWLERHPLIPAESINVNETVNEILADMAAK